jgi:hypothetical protein
MNNNYDDEEDDSNHDETCGQFLCFPFASRIVEHTADPL